MSWRARYRADLIVRARGIVVSATFLRGEDRSSIEDARDELDYHDTVGRELYVARELYDHPDPGWDAIDADLWSWAAPNC